MGERDFIFEHKMPYPDIDKDFNDNYLAHKLEFKEINTVNA